MFKKLLPFFIPLAFLPTLIETSRAGLIVTDPTLIATNQAHHAKDLAEQLIRKANQETQILRLAEQIAQTEDYLERYGHPGIPVANPELRRLIDLLRAASLSKSTEELIRGVDGSEIFRTKNSDSNTTSAEITLDDGKTVARNPALYKQDAVAKRGFDHYHEVRTEVLERRNELRSSVASTTAQLQAAQTESEVRKLTAVLTGLQTELSAIDQEIGFAASELVAQQSRAEADRRLRAKARLEDDRTRHREASRKDAQFYRLMTSPTYFRSRK